MTLVDTLVAELVDVEGEQILQGLLGLQVCNNNIYQISWYCYCSGTVVTIISTDINILSKFRYPVGSPADIVCYSNLTVHSIHWLNNSNSDQVLASNTGEQELVLHINVVTEYITDRLFTCEMVVSHPLRSSETSVRMMSYVLDISSKHDVAVICDWI